jgi:two-component system, OmpR family, phosphate regulon sensor histidine kinase PhoR
MQLINNGVMTWVMAAEFNSNQLASLVDALADAAIVVSDRGQVLSSNERADTLFEVRPVGQHLTYAFRSPVVLQAVNEALLQSKTSRVQHNVRTPVARTLDVHVSPLGYLDQSMRIALIVMRDLTREQQIERMRADFVANASHELRTPLASLAGFIETLQGAAKNDPKAQKNFLALMKTQADRMARLIDDLLSLSRIEISEHVQPTGTVELVEVVNRACDILKIEAKAVGCEIRIDMAESLLVVGEEDQLSQVVHNLIENAIKYGGVGKFIDVEARSQNGMVSLSVRDYGPGIAAQHVPRLTERFYRVNVQDSRTRGGTGLGLAITKHIINRHRGRLAIESVPGKGSVFSISLPGLK